MTDASVRAEPDRDEIYWIEKLAEFRHGARLLPCALSAASAGTAHIRTVVRLSAPPRSIDILCLAAFVFAIGRDNGEQPVLVASPAGPSTSDLMFFRSATDDTRTAAALLADIAGDVEASRRHAPCLPARIAPALGVSEAGIDAAFLQLAYTFGGADPSPLRDRAQLMLHADAQDGGVALDLAFDASRYPDAFVRGLAGRIARAIEWLAADDPLPLRDADLLTPGERGRLARGFHGARTAVPAGLTLHGLVHAQAARAPDSTAVVYNDVELSYRQLDQQANRIADALLRHYHVKRGDVVGVMLERSAHTVVALLGVMKAGAAYVPINPRHPWDTVSYMLENAGVTVLLVDSDSIGAAAKFSGQLLVMDIELRGSAAADDVQAAASGADLAYVIYTSGSTGRPKGVAVEHRAAVNTILWRNAFYGLTAADVNLQIPSFSFDSSVVDIFCVLSSGGLLLIPGEEARLDARQLEALCARRGVTTCILTPSYYKLLVGELKAAAPSLRCVTLAGETATADLVAAHLAHLPGVALFNEYGPTENAVCSSACRLDAVEPTASIGKPIDNVDALILDAHRRLCPVGVAGEIYLGGAGLARGYINQPGLTADRFVPSPIADYEGRLYRTGDRAAWRDDGAIEFLGRFDNQVKVRGFRIELDEVELALLQHADVRSAAVLCKDDPGGAKYLAAYAEVHGEGTRAALREHLRTRLPYYMVPDVLTVLPRLPLNVSGKIDRRALRARDDFASEALGAGAPPSPLEASLLGLSADVLKRVNIALDDNLFELGCNSLRVMELTSRIRGEMSLDVELLDIYSFPTIRELADRLSQTSQER